VNREVVNREAFENVVKALEKGDQLTLDAIGLVFGVPFYQLLVICLMDAQEAALAIAGSIKRLSEGRSDNIKDEIYGA
jgi:hypothetical protein